MNPLLAILAPQLAVPQAGDAGVNAQALGAASGAGVTPQLGASSALSAGSSAFLQLLTGELEQQAANSAGSAPATPGSVNSGYNYASLLRAALATTGTPATPASGTATPALTESLPRFTNLPTQAPVIDAEQAAVNTLLSQASAASSTSSQPALTAQDAEALLQQALNSGSEQERSELAALAQKIVDKRGVANAAAQQAGTTAPAISPLDQLINRLATLDIEQQTQQAAPAPAAAATTTTAASNTALITLGESADRKQQPVRFLSASSKLFDASVNNPTNTNTTSNGLLANAATPLTDEKLAENNAALARAAKAYVKFDGKAETLSSVVNGPVLPGAANSNLPQADISYNNVSSSLTSLDGARLPQPLAPAPLPAEAYTAYQRPATYLPATEQASVRIAEAMKNGLQNIRIELEPAKLGHLDVHLQLSKDGESHVRILVERPETLALLQRDAVLLREALNNAGFNMQSNNMDLSLRGEGNPGGRFDQAGNDNFDQSGNSHGKRGGGNAGADAEQHAPLAAHYRINLAEGAVDITV